MKALGLDKKKFMLPKRLLGNIPTMATPQPRLRVVEGCAGAATGTYALYLGMPEVK